jgi:hypothetical protein
LPSWAAPTALLEDIGIVYSKTGQVEKAQFHCDVASWIYGAIGNREAEKKAPAVLESLDNRRRGKAKMKLKSQMELAQSPVPQIQ